MSEDPFDQELKQALAAPELASSFVEEVIRDIDRQRRRTRWGWTVAASFLVLLGGLSWVFWPAKLRVPFPQATAQLSEGRLDSMLANAPESLWAGHELGDRFVLPVGARLRTDEENFARIEIGNLGILTLERESQAEVKSMEWKQFGTGAALGAVTVGVIMGAIEWRSGGKTLRAGAGEELKLQAAEAAAQVPPEIAALHKEKEALLAKLDEAQARVTELEKAATRTPVAAKTEPEMANAPEPVAPKKLAARFGDPELQKVLEEVDWDKAGEAFKHMIPIMAELLDSFENDKPLPESVAELQKWNADLVGVALKFMSAGVPGTGVNGSFTHPTAAANQIYASLEKIGQPLDASQQAALESVTRNLASEDHARLAAYGEDATALRKLLDETALKDRFYEEAGRIMTPQQRAALYPERSIGRLNADLYSTGIVWGPVTRGMPVRDRADFEGQIQDDFSKKFKLDAAGKAQLSSIVKEWSTKHVSDALLAYSPDKLGGKGMHKAIRARQAAEQQVLLQEKILAGMNLTPTQKKKLLQDPTVWLPFLQKD